MTHSMDEGLRGAVLKSHFAKIFELSFFLSFWAYHQWKVVQANEQMNGCLGQTAFEIVPLHLVFPIYQTLVTRFE